LARRRTDEGRSGLHLSPATEAEIASHLRNTAQDLSRGLDLDGASLPCTRREIEELRRRVEQVHGFAIVEPLATLRAAAERRALTWLIGRLLGEPIEQSGEGIKVV
jgi:hypothetical protein